MTEPVQMPPCPCSDPLCESTGTLVNEILTLLHERIPDPQMQVVAALAVASRLAVELNVNPEALLEVITDQSRGIIARLAFQAINGDIPYDEAEPRPTNQC